MWFAFTLYWSPERKMTVFHLSSLGQMYLSGKWWSIKRWGDSQPFTKCPLVQLFLCNWSGTIIPLDQPAITLDVWGWNYVLQRQPLTVQHSERRSGWSESWQEPRILQHNLFWHHFQSILRWCVPLARAAIIADAWFSGLYISLSSKTI